MQPSRELSNRLANDLIAIEVTIKQYIKDNIFFIDFRQKSWASTVQGQKLVSLVGVAVNLRYIINDLADHGF